MENGEIAPHDQFHLCHNVFKSRLLQRRITHCHMHTHNLQLTSFEKSIAKKEIAHNEIVYAVATHFQHYLKIILSFKDIFRIFT